MQNSKRVAINTFVQYARLFINLVVGLYSIRVILNALGASDYGVYDVIAGVITILGFVSTSLSQTSIRFISVSLGKNDIQDLRSTFNNCFWLHTFIGLALVALMEIVGLFLFDGQLNIPEDRIFAAKIVYHCMCLTLFMQILVTPFSALITSHEKFIYTSAISILDSLLKLGIAFALIYTTSDKLILYGILMMVITLVNTILYIMYDVLKYHREMQVSRPSPAGIKKQSGFAGWTVLDVMGSVATRQGYSITLNKFFGTTTNAVFALSRQVEGQMYSLSAAVIDTMKPQIMKSYGANDKERMFRLSMTAGKFGFSLMSLVSIPLLVFMPEVLKIWLGNVPDGTVLFTRLMVLACMAEQLTRGLVYACQATGRIKWFSIIVACIRFMALPVSILLFSLGLPSYAAIIVFLACEVLGSLARIFIISKQEGIRVKFYLNEILVHILPPFAIALGVLYFLSIYIRSIYMIGITSIIIDVFYLIFLYLVCLSTTERNAIRGIFARFKK